MDGKIKQGRPPVENKKRHLPRVTIYPETIEKMQEIAETTDRSQSDIYQDALDLFILKYERKKNIISL